MVALGYLSFGVSHPSVLDVGCGHGRLLQLLEPLGFKEYVGVDYSAEAIRRAESLSIANTRFEVADFEAWDTLARFDVVMLHECLYYARDPRRVLERALAWLTSDGVLVLSMFSNPHATRIWTTLENVPVSCLGWTTVTDRYTGNVWDVKALQSVRAPGSAHL